MMSKSYWQKVLLWVTLVATTALLIVSTIYHFPDPNSILSSSTYVPPKPLRVGHVEETLVSGVIRTGDGQLTVPPESRSGTKENVLLGTERRPAEEDVEDGEKFNILKEKASHGEGKLGQADKAKTGDGSKNSKEQLEPTKEYTIEKNETVQTATPIMMDVSNKAVSDDEQKSGNKNRETDDDKLGGKIYQETDQLALNIETSNTGGNSISSNGLPSDEPVYTLPIRQRDDNATFPSIFAYDEHGKQQLIGGKWTQMPGATKELVLSAPELFEKIPLHFMDNFKNPCWVRGETELNCLPYFYVIGMFKCGTTDIYDKIVAHPDVIDVPKEPHWWGPRRHGYTATPIHKKEVLRARELTGGKDDRPLEWYLNLYKFSGIQRLIDNTVVDDHGNKYHGKVFGDSSISTAYTLGLEWTESYPDAKEPLYTNADLIRALQPNAKIIIMIRNPTVRASSWYWYSNNPGQASAPTEWHRRAKGYMNCFKKCLQSHNLRYCAYASGCPYKHIPDLQVGIYHVYIRDWINAFSRDGVFVIRLEDWKADPVKVYRELLTFLDLRQLSDSEEKSVLQRDRKNVNHRGANPLPETVEALEDFYRPYNKELAKLMGHDKYLYS